MANVDLSLINAALTRTGNDPISSLDDGSVASKITLENYEFVVRAELARSRFKLPTKIQQLSLINSLEEGLTPEPWEFAYTLPTDLIKLRTVMVDGVPIAYEQMGKMILCNVDQTQTVIAKYLWRIPESWFAPEFAEGIIRTMEAIFLRGIGERYAEATDRDDAAKAQLATARSSDAQAQTPQEPVSSPALRARTGTATSSGSLKARRA